MGHTASNSATPSFIPPLNTKRRPEKPPSRLQPVDHAAPLPCCAKKKPRASVWARPRGRTGALGMWGELSALCTA